jgi:hypothetical protein
LRGKIFAEVLLFDEEAFKSLKRWLDGILGLFWGSLKWLEFEGFVVFEVVEEEFRRKVIQRFSVDRA